MYTTFHINTSELDESFIKKLKSLFKNKDVAIIVEEELDETSYLTKSPANKTALDKAIKNIEAGKTTVVDIDKYLKNENS